MPIKVKCSNAECGKVLAVKDEFAGKRAKCPGCGGPIQIPNGAPAAAIAPAQAAPARRPAPPPPVADEGFAAAAPPAARRRAAAPVPAEAGFDEGGGDWAGGPAPKSGLVTAVAVLNFVFGGLAIVCGAFAFLVGGVVTGLGAAAANTPQMTIKINGKDVPVGEMPNAAEFKKNARAVGGTVAMVGTIIMITSIVTILWGAAAIPGGIGLLKRRSWGRVLTLILAGVAIVLGLVSLYPVFMGAGVMSLVNTLIYLAYAGFALFVLLKPDVKREFA